MLGGRGGAEVISGGSLMLTLAPGPGERTGSVAKEGSWGGKCGVLACIACGGILTLKVTAEADGQG